jgi:hypothetical protein
MLLRAIYVDSHVDFRPFLTASWPPRSMTGVSVVIACTDAVIRRNGCSGEFLESQLVKLVCECRL